MLSQRTSRCGEQFQGFPFCIYDETTNHQLCSAVPRLPPPPVQCSDTDSDVLWSKKECWNETHTLYRSGRCINGENQAKVAKVEACGGYCHQCSNSAVICSMSDDPQIACLPQSDDSECIISGTVSSFEGCANENTLLQRTQTCTGGRLETDNSEQACATKYADTPRCLACISALFCAAEGDVTCETFGSTPLVAEPVTHPDNHDGVDCPTSIVNVNYYQESCFNSTHVRLLQGDCSNGSKLKSQSNLVACSEYGEDESRKYCHKCGMSVSCSSMPERDRACDRVYHDRTCDADASDLRGNFGCLNDEIFFTDFASCTSGVYTSETNGFRCDDAFQGTKYCNTCGNLNLCTDQKRSCSELGF